MALILKSNQEFTGVWESPALDAYKARVAAAGGVIKNESMLSSAFLFMERNNFDSSLIHSATSANWGIKEVGGNVTYLFSLFGFDGDLVVEGGGFPLQEIEGKFSFYASDTQNRMVSQRSILDAVSLSFFQNYHPTVFSSAATTGVVFESADGDSGIGVQGLKLMYLKSGSFTASGYGTTGLIPNIPKGNDVSLLIDQTGFYAYRNGVFLDQDLAVAVPSAGTYKVLVASQDSGSAVSAPGNYYATIHGRDMTQEQVKALSSFIAAIA